MVSFLKFFALIMVTMLGGCIAGGVLGSGDQDPADVRWEQIIDPPERPVRLIDISGYGRNAPSLTIETVSGRQYECCGFWPMTWKEVAYESARLVDSCPAGQDGPLNQAPGKVVDCAFVWQWEWVTEEHYVVLLEDGNLWRWRFYSSIIVQFQSMIWGALAGFVVGIAIIIYWRRKQNA